MVDFVPLLVPRSCRARGGAGAARHAPGASQPRPRRVPSPGRQLEELSWQCDPTRWPALRGRGPPSWRTASTTPERAAPAGGVQSYAYRRSVFFEPRPLAPQARKPTPEQHQATARDSTNQGKRKWQQHSFSYRQATPGSCCRYQPRALLIKSHPCSQSRHVRKAKCHTENLQSADQGR